MTWHVSVYMLPSLFAGALSIGVAVLAWRHRSERTARPFILLMCGLAWWALAYGVELGYADAAAIRLWDKIAFAGSVTVPTALFLLGLEYAGFDDGLPTWTGALLLVEPLLTLAFVWSYPSSTLVWQSVAVRPSGSLVLPAIEFGAWYWVNYAYSYLLLFLGLAAIASVFVRGSRIYRRQSALLILGAAVPLGANLLYNLVPEASPFPAVDLTTFAMAITGALYGLALFRFKMLDLAPAARETLLNDVGDGFVVVDTAGAYTEGNAVGRRVVDRDDAHFGDRSVGPERLRALEGQIATVTVDGTERSYELRTSPVTDFRDERVGTLVVFRDITELEVIRRHEQRLGVMNRVLRHNIRNEMNVVMGYADLLAESLSGERREYADAISTTATRMAAIGEKARHVGADLDASEGRHAIDVVPAVAAVVERAAAEYPAATVSLEAPDGARAMVAEASDVETALEYLIENAVVHADAEDPDVAVSVRRDGDAVEIAVADDGPGIPPGELEAVRAETETPLEHGSGLGLWIVYWLVSHSEGSLSFEENDPRGSVVRIRLAAA